MKKDGFTLLELLVTLGLFAAIMGLLMNVFFQFKDQSTRFESMMALRQEARVLEHLLRQDLQAAVNLSKYATSGGGGDEPNRSGVIGVDEQEASEESDELHLHVNRPVRFFRGLEPNKDPELHEVSYFLDLDDNERKNFTRREQFYIDSDMTDGENSISHVLSTNVAGLDLKFYLSGRAEPLDEWGTSAIQREFEAAVGVPPGIQVTLKLKSPSGEILENQFQINLQPDMGADIKWK